MGKQLIQRIELGSAQAAIEFTSIPQTFTDLYIVCSLRGQDSVAFWQNAKITFNNNAANYSWKFLVSSGEFGVESGSGNNQSAFQGFYTPYAQSTSNTFSNGEIYIPNYRSNTNKLVSYDSVTEHNGTQAMRAIVAGIWANTSAITSVKLEPAFGTNWVQFSSASLYGFTRGTSGGTTVS